MSARGTTLAIAYVGVVAVLAGLAFGRADQSFGATEALVLVLTLPTVVLALPLIYLVGATAWNLTGADHGGPMWPVTTVYVSLFVSVSVANVLVAVLLRRFTSRSSASG